MGPPVLLLVCGSHEFLSIEFSCNCKSNKGKEEEKIDRHSTLKS